VFPNWLNYTNVGRVGGNYTDTGESESTTRIPNSGMEKEKTIDGTEGHGIRRTTRRAEKKSPE
jgi:hypothetical protein